MAARDRHADRATRNVRGLRAERVRPGVDGGQSGAAEVDRAGEAAGRRACGREVLAQVQDQEKVREVALRPVANQSGSQSGLPLLPHRHETALSNSQKADSSEVKVRALQVE